MSIFLSFSLYVAHSLFLPPQTKSLYLSLTLSPTLSLFVSFSLSHPTSTFFSLSVALPLSPNMSLFIFSLCLPCSLALPTLSLFQSFSLSHPVSFFLPPLSLSLPPTLFLFHTVSHSIFLSTLLSLFLSCYPHTVSLSSTMPLYLCLPLRLSHKERER